MKKRRVFALFLALSIAFSSNGFTVLASETNPTGSTVSTVVEETTVTEETENSTESGAGDETGTEGETRTEGENGSGEGTGTESETGSSEGTGTEGEAGSNEGTGTEGETGSGEGTGTEGETGSSEETGTEGETGSSEGTGTESETGSGEDTEIEEDTEGEDETEEDSEAEEETEEETSEEEEELEEDPTKVKEGEVSTAPRMLSFTDEVGMVITYDANEAAAYQYTVSNGVLTGITTESGAAVSGNVVIAADQGITSIGENAFKGNTGITYVKLPSGVTSIAANAFNGCTSLKGITIPNGTVTIGDSAFEGCSAMTQLALPKTITSIGSKAFYNNSRLFMVYMKDASYSQMTTIGDSAFYGCSVLAQFCSDTEFILPGALQSIGASAFYNCRSIKTVTLPNTVTSLGNSVFYNCTSLTDVTLSTGLSVIPQYAFSGCSRLASVKFANGNTTIDSYAFQGCYALGGITFPFTMAELKSYAFLGCSSLKAVEIPNGMLVFGENAFPDIDTLYLIGYKGSTAEAYAAKCNINFTALNDTETVQYFTYTVKVSGSGSGSLNVTCSDKKTDPNKKNSNQGVKAGEEIYVGVVTSSSSKLVEGSLKCNGTEIKKNSSGYYVFTMPNGGALITAEFESTGANATINGLAENVEVELSNGNELKIGQYTRLFLLDTSSEDNSPIASSKITFKSNKPKIASVTSTGMIKALAKGDAKITATVKGGDGQYITKEVVISVVQVDVESIKLKLSSYDSNIMEVIENTGEVAVAAVDQTAVKTAKSFQMKATAYDADDDDMSVALKWTSSDAKVAKLTKASTTDADPYNTITIPANASGEATITVTATNADKTVVTQKFIVSVRDYTPRLASSAITLNPNQTQGAVLEVISAYDRTVDADTVKLVYADTENDSSDFSLTYDEENSTDTCARFYVKAAYDTLEDGKYSVKVSVNNKKYMIPLTITVKRSVPNPKVKIDTKTKINLFYANDGTQIKPVISNLGTVIVSEYSLEPLSDSDDDKLFTENFQIDPTTGVITQKSTNMQYTSKKKPAVTGYLVIKYDGYQNKIEKKFKITIPTTTSKPSYQLNKTSDTYNMVVSDEQTVTIQLLDKKTKKKVTLDDTYTVTNLASSTTQSVDSCIINGNGEIELTIRRNPSAGKVNLKLTNSAWAAGQSFTYTYTLKTTASDPKITLKNTTVSLNKAYPEQTAEFSLKSNQYDTEIAPDQTFTANSNTKNAAQYDKLQVTYENGKGTVAILDNSITNGTYRFTSYIYKINARGNRVQTNNKVTLIVKVSESKPTVTVKGTVALNLVATDEDYNYVETSELALTVKNLPAGYALNETTTLNTIACTTKGAAGMEDNFQWDIEDGKLKISLLNEVAAKTYTFEMTPTFDLADGDNTITAKSKIKFNVRIYKGTISVNLTARGKINLLDRAGGVYTDKNCITYTPTLKNLKDTVVEAKIYDAADGMPQCGNPESEYFDIEVINGKLYVAPKEGVEIENNKSYKIKIWMKLNDYEFADDDGGIWFSRVLLIRTAQTLPKVTTNKTDLNLYLSNKNYTTTFTVTPKEGSVGKISKVVFGDKDEKSADSFEVISVPQADGSVKVTVKLKNTVSYACNSKNKIKMYVMYEGQGVKTSGTAITMNFKINK